MITSGKFLSPRFITFERIEKMYHFFTKSYDYYHHSVIAIIHCNFFDEPHPLRMIVSFFHRCKN